MTVMVNQANGGRYCTLAEACAVPLPTATETYTPVANGDLVRMAAQKISSYYNVANNDIEVKCGLSAKDQQFFASLSVKSFTHEENKSLLQVVLGNSYNKTLCARGAGGINSWVCDNLHISGDIKFMRKHTSNVWQDLDELLNKVVEGALPAFNKGMNDANCMREIELDNDEAFEIMGVSFGHDIVKPQQLTLVRDEWLNPSYDEFLPRSAWSLYNCFTEGLKRGPISLLPDRTAAFNEFFMKEVVTATAA